MSKKIALVTGGSSGIGKATAIELANQGYKVFITGRNKSELAKTQAKHPENIISLVVDFNHPGFAEEILSLIKERAGEHVKIERLIHCAAIIGPIDKLTNLASRLEESMQINAYAPLMLTHTLLPLCHPNTRVSIMSSKFVKPDKLTPFIDIFGAYISSKIVLLNCLILSYPVFKGKISIEIPELHPVKDTIIYNYFLTQRLEIFINNNQEIKSSLDQEQLTKLKDEILKQAPIKEKSTAVITFIENELEPNDNLYQLIHAKIEKILEPAITPEVYAKDHLINKHDPIENLFEPMREEFKILAKFLKSLNSEENKLPEFIISGVIKLPKELLHKSSDLLTKHTTCESLFKKIDNILEEEIRNIPISKITGNPHTTFQLQSHSDHSTILPIPHLNRFSPN